MVMGRPGPADIIGPQSYVAVGPVPHDIRAADFNRDGYIDLAILFAGSPTNPNGEYARSATILLGRGNGTFSTPFSKVLEVTDASALLEVGDFDGNGWTDVAVVSPAAATIQIAWNMSTALVLDFAKRPPTLISCGTSPRAVRSADLDGNGVGDLIVARAGSPGEIEVRLFASAGEAGEPIRTGSAADPKALRVQRLVGGGPWTAVVLDGAGALLAHEWEGDRFGAAAAIALPPGGTSLAVGDIDGDGRADAVVAYRGHGTAAILLGVEPAEPMPFRRGDFVADGIYTIGDAISFLSFLFAGGPAGPCPDAGDTDDDGSFTLGDAIYTLNYLFASGPVPPPPGVSCGLDPTPDGIDARFGPCRYPDAACR